MFKPKSILDLFFLLILFFVGLWWGQKFNLFPGRAEPIQTLPVAEGVTDPVRLEAHRRVTELLQDDLGGVPIRTICSRQEAARYPANLVVPRISSAPILHFKDIKIAAVIELYRYVHDEQPLAYMDLSDPRSSSIRYRKTTVGQFAWCAIHRLLIPPDESEWSEADSQWIPFNILFADVLDLPEAKFQQLVSDRLDPWYQRCIDEEGLVFRCGVGEVPALVEHPPEAFGR